jgi:hypothetical protein
MNIIDGICFNCGIDIRWISGTPRLCRTCYGKQKTLWTRDLYRNSIKSQPFIKKELQVNAIEDYTPRLNLSLNAKKIL